MSASALHRFFGGVLLAAFTFALAGCGEKLSRPDPEAAPAYNTDNTLRERTLNQGESERIGH